MSDTQQKGMGEPRRSLEPGIKRAMGVALGVVALYLAARGLDFAQLAEVLQGVHLPLVLLTLAVYVLNQLVKGIRWRRLLASRPPRLTLTRLSSLLVIGQAVNLLVPARVGDLMRAYLAGEEGGVSKLYVLGTIAGEKLLDLMALALLVLALLPSMALPAWLAGRVGPVEVSAVALAVGLALLVIGRRFWLALADRALALVSPAFAERWHGRLAAGMDGLAVLAEPRAAVSVWAWTLVSWLLAALTNLLLFVAFNLPASPLAALFLLAVLQAGVAVPSSPGKIGVFHILCVLALSAFGIPGTVALGYGLVLHLIVVGASSAWAAIAFWQRSWELKKAWVLDT